MHKNNAYFSILSCSVYLCSSQNVIKCAQCHTSTVTLAEKQDACASAAPAGFLIYALSLYTCNCGTIEANYFSQVFPQKP